MITRRVLINLGVFFTLSAVLIGYGAFSLLGNPFDDPRTVRTVFDDASGVLPDFSASVNGVVVGVVSDVDLLDDGVEVTVELDPGKTVPGDSEASIIRASAVGEQRVEFTPTDGGTADPVPDGGSVPAADDAAPPEVSVVLDRATDFIEALPEDELDTLVREAAIALRGRSEELAAFAPQIDTFNQKFLEHEEEFRALLEDAPPVLDALVEVSPELRRALADTAAFTGTLAERREDMTSLLQNGAGFAEVAAPLLRDQRANLACLFDDAAELNDFLARPEVLRNIELGFDLNEAFFGPISALAVEGPARGFPQYGSSGTHEQAWLRVSLLFPPGQPTASRYAPIRRTPDVLPGAGCTNVFGDGVGPASQPGRFEPEREERLVRAQTNPTSLAPVPGFSSGTDADAAEGAGDRAQGGDDALIEVGPPPSEGSIPGFFGSDGSDDASEDGDGDVALDAAPASDEGSGLGWVWLVVLLSVIGGAAAAVIATRRRSAGGSGE